VPMHPSGGSTSPTLSQALAALQKEFAGQPDCLHTAAVHEADAACDHYALMGWLVSGLQLLGVSQERPL
jgi:hypothetical protein